jgi:hypothetical protein
MSAETWAKILYTYGPFAILVFLVVVIERVLYARWRAANQNNHPQQTAFLGLYAITWCLILGVAIYSIYVWKRINLDKRPQISGKFENLSNLESLGTTAADLYLHKNPKGGVYSDYDLLLVNKDKRWDDGAIVTFTIQTPPRTGNQDGDVFEYDLPIQSAFYDSGVVLKRKHGKLFLALGGQEKELHGELLAPNAVPSTADSGTADSKTTTSKLALPELFPVAYAQETWAQTPIQDFSVGLESPDALVRRKTRAQLARQNPIAAVPWIEDVLEDTRSSYRLRLGVLAALNQMADARGESLRPATIAVMQSMLCDSDDTLRNEAYSYLQKNDLMPVVLYEHVHEGGRSQGFGPCKYRADKGQFWKLSNDTASSIKVGKGYTVRLCEHEGAMGTGAGKCEVYYEGSRDLGSLSDLVSFVDVTIARSQSVQQRALKRK